MILLYGSSQNIRKFDYSFHIFLQLYFLTHKQFFLTFIMNHNFIGEEKKVKEMKKTKRMMGWESEKE